MAYGLKYQTSFDSQSDENTPSKTYTIQFLYKDYSGGSSSVICADEPLKHSYGIDDPMATIKGSSVTINLLNINGALPLSNFYSEESDGIMVILTNNAGAVLFKGFIVQDDSYETMVDFTHVISLSANDSLGLLKGVILSDVILRRSFLASYQTNGNDFVVYVDVKDTAFYPAAGDTITFDGNDYIIVTALNEPTVIGSGVYNWTITVSTSTGGISIHSGFTIYLTGKLNLLARNSLLTFIAACLVNTNLALILNIFCNISAYRQLITRSHFEQTVIDSQIFISGETYSNCYDVLTKILSSFRCSLFQANGEWNIMHWDEMRFYTNQAIPGYQYDERFDFLGTTSFTNIFGIGPAPQLTRPLFPFNKGLVGSYKFVRKTFNYVMPKYLLRNYDLQTLGPLISQTVVGSNTYYDYYAVGWQGGDGTPLATRVIRVIKDATGTELERYLVCVGPHFNSIRAVQGTPFEANKGDKIKFSFSFRTEQSQTGSFIVYFAVMLTDGNFEDYVSHLPDGNGAWGGSAYEFVINGGDNSNTWHNVEIPSSEIPYSGLIYCYLAVATKVPGSSTLITYYKDIRLEYTPHVNDTTKITGQIHENNRGVNVKSNSDTEIYIDNSPRNPIAGTLFLTTFTGLLQDRTKIWIYNYDIYTGYNQLNEMLTREEISLYDMLRIKHEGEFVGLYQQNVVSMLTLCRTDFNPTKNFIFGLLNIDYKRNTFNGTLYEIYDSTEAPLSSDYTFKYIYSPE